MRVFKNRQFAKWAKKEKLTDEALCDAVDLMESGTPHVNLGGGLVKQRVALKGKGKSGGVRSLIAFKRGKRSFFIYGFSKGERSNISESEERNLKKYAKVLLNLSEKELAAYLAGSTLIEITRDETVNK
ncbi:type II toxin-antitoxin system RelE/ParE family toxin (plasmid) [Microbulbifer sp. ANSA001]|uniref:type II toxin-antitoxin system RelE/ParE family toxin n=1 Tax=Microbulbifer sp. ANSA001 TaxID=3243358 RepID=UPI004042F3A4